MTSVKHDKSKITVEINLEPIIENINKYVTRKVREAIRDSGAIEDATVEVNFPMVTVRYPRIEGRLERLEDWKHDIEQGWVTIK